MSFSYYLRQPCETDEQNIKLYRMFHESIGIRESDWSHLGDLTEVITVISSTKDFERTNI